MREFIIENLTDAAVVDLSVVVLNNVVAMALAFFVMFTYKITYSGTAYSRKFNLTLGSITIITTMIMSIISNNVALSLGMVGALSIIRYRTAVKDVRDASFIFWAIALGIGCGVSQYTLVGTGSISLFLFMMLTKQDVDDKQKLLIVQGIQEVQSQIEAMVDTYFGGKAVQIMNGAAAEECELIYSVKARALKKANEKNASDIVKQLSKVEGISRVNLVDQSDEISR
ncbi:MAG: DUF4956 domain-containing protein [Lachnospiraceae bacterium]|nr:DUF4956 domain-containing protein [Lachnospiraceae bacterium]